LYSGTLTSTVRSGDPTNPLGGLTFTYLITNNAASNDAIHRLTINSYSNATVDGSYFAPPGLAPTLIDRSAADGDTIGFSFIGSPVGPGTLSPGLGSALLVLRTASQSFVPTFA